MIQEISDVIDKIQSSTIDGSGLTCNFYRIGNVGAKVYDSEYDAIDNMKSQQLLHSLGFAPKVLSEIITFDDNMQHMFLTELAITVNTIVDSEGIHSKDKDIYDYRKQFAESHRFRHFAKLIKGINDAGYDDWDNHWGNYGYLPNGKPVVIDCEFVHN